jgi:thymidylate synthase (FAD)
VKTELIMYASLPEWRHIFDQRCAKAADPEMRRIMVPLREQFRAEYPEMWEGEKE